MNYLKIDDCDLNNGVGTRVTLWVSGCDFRCIGCHNSDYWDYECGKEFNIYTIEYLKKLLNNKYITGLSILGGEPLAPKNRNYIIKLCDTIKKEFPNKDIWLWTGYKIENLDKDILKDIDVIIDGQFEINNPTNKKWRGSDNQRMWEKDNGIFIQID